MNECQALWDCESEQCQRRKYVMKRELYISPTYELTWVIKGETAMLPWQSCISRGNCCADFLFEYKVSISLLVGTLSLLVIVISRLSLCDVLLLVCPCMRSSIRKGTCPSSQRVSFYQSLHLCFYITPGLPRIIRKVRQSKNTKESNKK